MVSGYEKHFEKTRQLTEENALGEMEIAENGTSVFRANPLLETANNMRNGISDDILVHTELWNNSWENNLEPYT